MIERLHARGDQVLVVHRGRSKAADWLLVAPIYTDRRDLANRSAEVTDVNPQAIVDTCAMTAADVDSVVPDLTAPC